MSSRCARCLVLASLVPHLVSTTWTPTLCVIYSSRILARTGSYSSETYKYPIMRTAPRKEKRIVRKVIDGVERDFEVEVEVEEPIKRLFLFGGARD